MRTDPTRPAEVRAVVDFKQVARAIHEGYLRYEQSSRERLRTAREIGEELRRVKQAVGPRHWSKWLRDHAPFVSRMHAWRFMRFAERCNGNVTLPIEQQEDLWRSLCGNTPTKAEREAGPEQSEDAGEDGRPGDFTPGEDDEGIDGEPGEAAPQAGPGVPLPRAPADVRQFVRQVRAGVQLARQLEDESPAPADVVQSVGPEGAARHADALDQLARVASNLADSLRAAAGRQGGRR